MPSTLNGGSSAVGRQSAAAVVTLDVSGSIIYRGPIAAPFPYTTLFRSIVNGGTLGGPGTIATATGNIDSTLNGVTKSSGTQVWTAVASPSRTPTTANNGEIDATTGTLDRENAIVNGGTLGGPGTIATAT